MAQPLCPYFRRCGGCTSQHVEYSLQLENKKKRLETALRFPAISVFSDQPYSYRNRLDILFYKGGVALRAKQSGLVPIEHCAIADVKINRLLDELNSFVKQGPPEGFPEGRSFSSFIGEAIIRTTTEGQTAIVFMQRTELPAEIFAAIKLFAKTCTAEHVLIGHPQNQTDEYSDPDPVEEHLPSSGLVTIKGSAYLSENYCGKEFLHPAHTFFQNNHLMAQRMHEYCHRLLEGHQTKQATLLDLYGGVGTFAIINAPLFKQAIIVESVAPAVATAQKNIERNNASNVKAILLDATRLKALTLPLPLFVITDPPRSGMDERTILRLKELQPQVIVYVSCNVEKLRKDVIKFSKTYAVKSAALFDFFPQTNHLEAVVELLRL